MWFNFKAAAATDGMGSSPFFARFPDPLPVESFRFDPFGGMSLPTQASTWHGMGINGHMDEVIGNLWEAMSLNGSNGFDG